ncbi:Putative universal stress protein [Pirellula sp. SH-Sr6A]|uniref:universal stress protein n=1 Tax=Pirellula sp. SH-Sr6A TaxID=1632865 RepID=UPI00078E7EFC|nr:universal stress protein [Pirellula sp. SH-Sr6A]AMV33555.1 Putative universal stress protein [Pirellula sp. SH-Sr6A]
MKVLLATDGSSTAMDAASLLARLPHRDRLELTILFVNQAYEFFGVVESQSVVDRCIAEEKSRGMEACQRAAHLFQGANATVETLVVDGHPGETIVDTAADKQVDLIVLGATGHTKIDRFLLGSVSDFVATHAKCSVLVARSQMLEELKQHELRICVGIDDSDRSSNAFSKFCEAGWTVPAQVDFVGVVRLPYTYSDIPIAIDTSNSKKSMQAKLAQTVVQCQHRFPAASIHVEEANHVGDTLVRFATKHHSDLMMLGDTGKGLMGRFLLGSVTRYVLRNAPCSIWISR